MWSLHIAETKLSHDSATKIQQTRQKSELGMGYFGPKYMKKANK